MRVDARDVLDANARTRRAFSAQIRGYFRRTGPNAWDDYELVLRDGGPIEVLPGLNVQLERYGATLRMRSGGRVLRVEWIPEQQERELAGDAPDERRAYFIAHHVERLEGSAGVGGAAVIASKLNRS